MENVLAWVAEVRDKSREYIASLTEEGFHKVPSTSYLGLSVAQWLFITVAHTALHIGVIKHLRALIDGKKERAC